jgi:cell division protein FtsL
MSGLETAFYIYSMVFYSIILVIVIAMVVAIFMIRAKVISIEKQIQSKVDQVTDIASKGGELVARVGAKAAGTAIKSLRKTTKKA